MINNWHTLDVDKVFEKLASSAQGLTQKEALARLNAQGPNVIPDKGRRSLLTIIFAQFADLMILVLLAAALISGVIGDIQDTAAILVIVILNALIGAVQQFRAEKAVAALKEMSEPDSQVLRDNQLVTIPTDDLVPGDVVLLEAGRQVPADLRVIAAEQMAVDESALTGESQTISKQVGALDQEDLPIGDRTNLIYKNTMVTGGQGRGIVVATGLDTEIGYIASLLRQEKGVKTPLQRRLANFGRYLALTVIAICILVFIAGLLQGQPPLLMFLTAVSLAVAAIPEALPAVVTISLALGAKRLIGFNALVRNLPAVETLGSVTYICSDKTGTLTQNKMTLELIVTAEEVAATLVDIQDDESRAEIGRILALNNDVRLQDGHANGEPTEQALYEAAEQAGYHKLTLSARYPRIGTVPFDSHRKMMTTLHQDDGKAVGEEKERDENSGKSRGKEKVLVLVKGAPESVLPQCGRLAFNTLQGDAAQQALLEKVEHLAQDGYRVLALARKVVGNLPGEISSDMAQMAGLESDLQFVGLVALVDPPREEAYAAVRDCYSAGITPVLITGDHPATAVAIAQRLGICKPEDEALTGMRLAQMNERELDSSVASIRVYARVSPEQKLRIVRALQAKQEFVAMTGDGVNDAPAIKQANIGVAMGLKGTDVARGAADMELLDDNFSTIVNAVKAGRKIFDNIRKFILYTMSSNAGEVWTLFLAPLLGLPIPLLPIHILWINIVTDGLPGLAFTAEPADPEVMKRPPRPPTESIFAHGMWQHILWVGLLIGGLSIASQAWALSRGAEYWQTIVFTVLTLSQLFHALAVRSESVSLWRLGLVSNLPMLAALVFTFGLQLAVIYVPLLNDIFRTHPLPLGDLLICIALSSIVFWTVEIEKWWVRKGLIYGH